MKIHVYCPGCRKLVLVDGAPGERVRCQACPTELEVPVGQDVFVSYSSQNLVQVNELADALFQAKINYWLAPEQIGPGASFPIEITNALERAKLLVLLLSVDALESTWVESEVIFARSNKLPILPLRIQNFAVPSHWQFLVHNKHQCTDEIPKLIQEIHKQLPRRDDPEERTMFELLRQQAQPILPSQPRGVDPEDFPYVGPGPFKEGGTHRFYGRFGAARELCLLIRRSRLTLVYAPSGAGKSSLFNTLIGQTLSDSKLGYKVHAGLRVGTTSLEAAATTHNVYTFSAISGFGDAAGNPRRSLTKYLASRYQDADAPRRVLIFDQFEELFTQYAEPFAKPSELHPRREEFFADLMEALQADALLHVVLIIREEYLARMNRWLKACPPDVSLGRFALNRLDREEAREAIVSPAREFAAYADDLVNEILDQLEADGAIEMVHLQIVCQRLWEELPPGLTLIQKSDVERMAGPGGTCQDFVKTAVKKFYENVVKEVARNQQPPKGQGRFPEELIYLGCKKFVATQSTRAVLLRDRERTGRLPNWVVKELENKHLLRCEERGQGTWYELSHDLLIRSVEEQSNPDINSLLFAAELLDKTIEAARNQNHQTLEGYFAPHADLLRASAPFKSQLVLFEEEAEFIFRASLAAGGEEMGAWSDLLEKSYPNLHENYLAIHRRVIEEALTAREIPGVLTAPEAALTRHNAATLLGERPAITGLLEPLRALALHDDDDDVRSAAAFALVQRQEAADCYEQVIKHLKKESIRPRALDALARMRVAADRIRPAENQQESAPVFNQCWRRVPLVARWNARLRGWWIRLVGGASAVPYIFFPAAVLAAGLASIFKVPFAHFNWAICQASASPGMGFFHGATAGVIWGGGIALALALYGMVFRVERHNNAFRPLGALFTGALAGFVFSFLLVVIIANVYESTSLFIMGWISNKALERFSVDLWRELFVRPGFAWPYLLTGAGLGLGMALMTNGMMASRSWLEFLDQESAEVSGLKHIYKIGRGIAWLALPYSLFIPPILFLSAVLAYQVMKPNLPVKQFDGDVSQLDKKQGEARLQKIDLKGLRQGLTADCATQAFGGFFAVVGMGFGMVVMRRGFRVKPRIDKPWRSAPLKIPAAGG